MGTLVTLLGLWFLRRESGSSSSMFLKVLCFVHMPGAWGGGGGGGWQAARTARPSEAVGSGSWTNVRPIPKMPVFLRGQGLLCKDPSPATELQDFKP